MKAEIEAAIKALAKKAKSAELAGHAMQFAQAALNLAQTFATLDHTNKQ